jgi:uncharacterized protein DUF222/HNH endonuclease
MLDRGGSMTEASSAGLDPAGFPLASRRAGAAVAICEAVVGGGAPAELAAAGPAHRVVVHVDLGVLTGQRPDGRCQVEGGSGISASVARRLGCEAEVAAVIERDGVPLDVRPARRFVRGRKRMAVMARDGGCRYPGCPVKKKYIQVHHIVHWADDHDSDLDNLLALCGFHHRRHHDGAFGITLAEDGRPIFLTPFGRPIAEPHGPPLLKPSREGLRRLLGGKADAINAETPVALDHGARFDLGLTTELLHQDCARARRAAEANAGDLRAAAPIV